MVWFAAAAIRNRQPVRKNAYIISATLSLVQNPLLVLLLLFAELEVLVK